MLFNESFDITTGYAKLINYGSKPARFMLNTTAAGSITLDSGNGVKTGTYSPALRDLLNTDLNSVYIEGSNGKILANTISTVYVFLADERLWAAHKNKI